MHDSDVGPYIEIALGGETHPLQCNMAVLREIQKTFNADVITVQNKAFSMSFDDLAKLFKLGIEKHMTVDSIAEKIVDEIGIVNAQAIAASWLAIAITPLSLRKKKAEEMKAMLEALDSRG